MNHSFDLKKKVALVTGGAGILGEKFCRALAQQGATVAIADLDLAKAQDLEKRLQSEGFHCKSYELDLAQEESIIDCVAKIQKDFHQNLKNLVEPIKLLYFLNPRTIIIIPLI